MTSGDVMLAACPACRYEPLSVNAAACPKCGEPITASTKSAMIQRVLAQRERAAREELDEKERLKKSEELKNQEREARLKRDAEIKQKETEILVKIDALWKDYNKVLVKCPVCSGSYTRNSGHDHTLSSVERDRILEKNGLTERFWSYAQWHRFHIIGASDALRTEEERKIKEAIDALDDEWAKLVPRCSFCGYRHVETDPHLSPVHSDNSLTPHSAAAPFG
jgi:hypothetical protein